MASKGKLIHTRASNTTDRERQPFGSLAKPLDDVDYCMGSSWDEWEQVFFSQLDFEIPQAPNSPITFPRFNLFNSSPGNEDPNFRTNMVGNLSVQAPAIIRAISVGISIDPLVAGIRGAAVPIASIVANQVPAFGGSLADLPAGSLKATLDIGGCLQRLFNSLAETRTLVFKIGLSTVIEMAFSDCGFQRKQHIRGFGGDIQTGVACSIQALNDQLARIAEVDPTAAPYRFVDINAEASVPGGALDTALPANLASAAYGNTDVQGYFPRPMVMLEEGALYVPGVPINAFFVKDTQGILDDQVDDIVGPPMVCGYGDDFGTPATGQNITFDEASLGSAATVHFCYGIFSIALQAYGHYVTPQCATNYFRLAYEPNFRGVNVKGTYGGVQLPPGVQLPLDQK